MAKKKVAVYYRTSKDSANLDKMQKIKCLEFCEKNNFEIVGEYKDLGVSGLKLNRKGLKLLRQDSDSKKFSGIVVYNFDRLARRASYLRSLSDEFGYKGIDVLSCTQETNTKTPEGRLIREFFFLFAELESVINSRRIKDGLEAKKKWVG